MTNRPYPDELCEYRDFADVLPVQHSREQIVKMSRGRLFPRHKRPAGRKSEPLWRKSEVLNWIRANYLEILPEAVERAEKSKFARPSAAKRKNT